MKVLNYKKSLSIITTIIVLLICTFQSVKAECNQKDFKALKAFYESTNGDDWANNTGWEIIRNNEVPPANCNLYNLKGVTVKNGRVVELRFRGPSEAISGNLPKAIYLLEALEILEITSNSLSGSIPQTIGYCKNLRELKLKDNNLTGSIPSSISFLKNLTNLTLGDNQFVGTIPTQIGNCSKLIRVELYNNNFTGCIPPEIGNLTKLATLNLSKNNLSNCIPPEIGNCQNLRYCYLNYNNLTDAIPSEIGNIPNLSHLYLMENELSGEIPKQFGQLKKMSFFNVSNNNITGCIPTDLGNCENLRYCILSNNEIDGAIPGEIGNINNLKKFYVNNNKLEGCFPENLRNICVTLDNMSNSNEKISVGNNFIESWENFDKYSMGMCGGSNRIASSSTGFVQIHPNPSNGYINLSIDNANKIATATSEIKIYNAIGSIVYTEDISNLELNNYSINLSHLTNGNYLIVLNSNSEVHHQKLILN